MIEVEVKVAVNDKKQLEEQLLKIGFEKGDSLKESDYYFDNEGNHIRKNDTALRVRNCENMTTNKSESFLTFKGPKMDKVSMTRKELETKIENAEIGIEILKSLGYTQIYPVVKQRQYFYRGQVTACVDQVEGLGDFLELEVIVKQESEKETALERVMFLFEELGYPREVLLRRSYLSMLQDKEEDIAFKIDYWAKIFKARTWKEIKMLAQENEYLQEAAESLYVANADEIVRQQCIAREDAERRERTMERLVQ